MMNNAGVIGPIGSPDWMTVDSYRSEMALTSILYGAD